MDNIGLQIVQGIAVVSTALLAIYKFISELRHQSIEGLIKYSAFFENSDKDFVDSFLRPEIKRRVYKRATGINFSYKEDATWLYDFFGGQLSWFYLSIVIPFLAIDRSKKTLTIKLDLLSYGIMVLCAIGLLDAILLLLLYSPLIADQYSLTHMLVSGLCVLYFLFCLSPFIMLWALKKRFLYEQKKLNRIK